jgi:hypothetical protein
VVEVALRCQAEKAEAKSVRLRPVFVQLAEQVLKNRPSLGRHRTPEFQMLSMDAKVVNSP